MKTIVCNRSIELLAVSLRPYYIPGEFSHAIVVCVYVLNDRMLRQHVTYPLHNIQTSNTAETQHHCTDLMVFHRHHYTTFKSWLLSTLKRSVPAQQGRTAYYTCRMKTQGKLTITPHFLSTLKVLTKLCLTHRFKSINTFVILLILKCHLAVVSYLCLVHVN